MSRLFELSIASFIGAACAQYLGGYEYLPVMLVCIGCFGIGRMMVDSFLTEKYRVY